MKMKFYLLTIMVSSLTIQSLAQTAAIHLSGQIDSSITHGSKSRELLIMIHNPFKELNNQEKMIKILIDLKGRFTTKIIPESKFTYLSFWMKHNNRSDGSLLPLQFPTRRLPAERYVFEAGDSISINFGKNGYLKFGGVGADKLNCQDLIYNLNPKLKSFDIRKRELLSAGEYKQALSLERESLNTMVEMRLKLLDTYKGKFSDELFRLIRIDAVANAKYNILVHFWTAVHSVAPEHLEDCIASLRQDYIKFIQTDKEETDSMLIQSAWYCEYLFEKEWNSFKLFSKNIVVGDDFYSMYETLRTKYNGQLRDRLLLIALKKMSFKFSEEIITRLDDAIKISNEESFKSAVTTLQETQTGKAYPFELEDANGKIHKLNDYKGKVLVLDFWFTGCIPCMQLNAAMKVIIKKYEKNDNILFLTICEDREREQWLKSVATGKYTGAETINLYTNGLGSMHPLMSFYGFVGAPQQLIIDKNGNLVSSTPPRPDTSLSNIANNKNGILEMNPADVLSNPSAVAFMKILDNLLIK